MPWSEHNLENAEKVSAQLLKFHSKLDDGEKLTSQKGRP